MRKLADLAKSAKNQKEGFAQEFARDVLSERQKVLLSLAVGKILLCKKNPVHDTI